MGLCVVVGAANSPDEDRAVLEYHRAQMAAVNRCLQAAGLAAHHEPSALPSEQVLSFDMFGYSGLHYLRRIAAHLDLEDRLPPPGDEHASDDPLIARYYAVHAPSGTPRPGLLSRLLRGTRTRPGAYDHLLIHGDAEGYYLPIDFPIVLFAPDREVAGGMIGSSHRLRAECRRLAKTLEIPQGLDPEADELWSAIDTQGSGPETWRRYGIESFTCVRLLAASERSIATGAAVTFC